MLPRLSSTRSSTKPPLRDRPGCQRQGRGCIGADWFHEGNRADRCHQASALIPEPVARASLDNQIVFETSFVAINVRCSGQLVTTGVIVSFPETQREHTCIRVR